MICDNYAAHKHAAVRAWLATSPRITLHFTPAGCSWLNLVECFFSIITRQAIRRGSDTSVRQLTATIGAFIDHWNDHPRPFAWTKNADDILGKIHRAKTKDQRSYRPLVGGGRPPSQPPPARAGVGELQAGQAGLRGARWWHGERGEH